MSFGQTASTYSLYLGCPAQRVEAKEKTIYCTQKQKETYYRHSQSHCTSKPCILPKKWLLCEIFVCIVLVRHCESIVRQEGPTKTN